MNDVEYLITRLLKFVATVFAFSFKFIDRLGIGIYLLGAVPASALPNGRGSAL